MRRAWPSVAGCATTATPAGRVSEDQSTSRVWPASIPLPGTGPRPRSSIDRFARLALRTGCARVLEVGVPGVDVPGRRPRAPGGEGDPVVLQRGPAVVALLARCTAVVGREHDREAVRECGVAVDDRQQPADLGVHRADGVEVLRGHEPVPVAGEVGRLQVQEDQLGVVAQEIRPGGGHQRREVGLDQERLDLGRPGVLEQVELVLAGVERGVEPGVLRHLEDRGDVVAGERVDRGVAVAVDVDAVPAEVGLDPAAGDHAGVVGQRDGLLDRRARVERALALVEDPPDVRQLRPAELGQRVGVEGVDRDREHVVGGAGRERPVRVRLGTGRSGELADPERNQNEAAHSSHQRHDPPLAPRHGPR